MLRYLQALGHRDPLVTLSAIQTADTKALASKLGAKPADVLRVQEAAARDMLPYVYAKKPVELALPAGDQRPVMIIGQMNVSQVEQQLTMSAGAPPEDIERFQRVTDGEAVRSDDDASHE